MSEPAWIDTLGYAAGTLGNHEFNAIAWATRDPDHPGKKLRRHDQPGFLMPHQFVHASHCS